MTTMKKLVSLILAVMMLLSVCAVANADETAKVSSMDDHTYAAYQIFTGTQAESEGDLGNVQWGTGINSAAFLTALKAETTDFNVTETVDGTEVTKNAFAACETAQDVATVLAKYGDSSAAAKKFARLAFDNKTDVSTPVTKTTTDLAHGYYLIVDTTENLAEGTAYNAALLQVTETITIESKTSAPEVEKKVKDNNDTTNTTTDWQDSADYDIGDEVPFQLTATLGNNLDYFETYKVEFIDTLSSGLTYKEIKSVVVNGHPLETGEYTVTSSGNSLIIAIDDVLKHGAVKNSKVVVEYTATLNENAVIGSAGNPNEVYLKYSNNPNVSSSEGNTPKDQVIVFTYKVVVDKVDENNQPLEGAGFTLYKEVKNGETKEWKAIGDELKGEALTTFEWKGLDDGNYKLVETTTPAGYNTIAPIEFTITATHDEEQKAGTNYPELTALDGGVLGTGAVDTGAIMTDVENRTGAELPETGGIGTTIFYAVGGLLVVMAVVLLITKRRVGEEN